MAFIEQARRNLQEKEAIEAACQEIFNASMSLLRENGEPNRDLVAWKYQTISHTVNSAQPPINVYLSTGANMDKANSVFIGIEGLNFKPSVTRKKRGGREIFEGKRQRSTYSVDFTSAEAQALLVTVKQLQRDLQTKSV